MSSSLRVNTIVPSTGTNVAIGTANGTVTFTDSVNFVLGTGSSIFSPASNTLTFGTNDAERLRITSDGKIGINQASPGAMLQVDYDEGSSEVGLRLRAYNASGSKTWQLSEINGNAGVFSIRNQTNSTEGLEIHADGHLRVPTGDLRVGDNTDSNAGSQTISVGSVSSGSGGIGIFANPTNGNSFVQFGDGTSSADQYRGYMNYRHADDSLRFGTANSDRLHIDANGRIGTNGRAPSSYNNPDLLISGDNATLTIMGDGSTNNSSIAAIKFRVAGTSTGDYTKAGIFVKRQDSYNDLDMIFAFRSSNDAAGVTLSDEKLRIDSDGRMGLGTNSPDSYDGEADNFVVASSDHTGITIASTGSNKRTNLYFADGTSGNERYRGAITYDHNSDYMMMRTTGTERVRILGSGFVNIGNGYLTNSNSGLHVGRSSGGTAAGESVLAATLGNDSSMISALLTVKNAGNRGSQGHGSGSPLAKFEFNNGTAFEIDKYGHRTLPYQPSCKISIDTNSTGGGNYAQTGKTIVPFNHVNWGHNTGNHFNTSNHTFTCPIGGKYLVILSVNVIGDNIAYIYKNGAANIGGEFRSNPTGTWEHMEISGVMECSANDTIQPYSQLTGTGRKFNGGSSPGTYWDSFSIYYLG